VLTELEPVIAYYCVPIGFKKDIDAVRGTSGFPQLWKTLWISIAIACKNGFSQLAV
jgi:hypothetical protein